MHRATPALHRSHMIIHPPITNTRMEHRHHDHHHHPHIRIHTVDTFTHPAPVIPRRLLVRVGLPLDRSHHHPRGLPLLWLVGSNNNNRMMRIQLLLLLLRRPDPFPLGIPLEEDRTLQCWWWVMAVRAVRAWTVMRNPMEVLRSSRYRYLVWKRRGLSYIWIIHMHHIVDIYVCTVECL